jgi:two-component system phosphate regulon sensor histidine kinase PhoR
MNKKKFIGLILLMLLSLTGIIWVQAVWISNALEIRNDSFNARVFAGLENAAKTIESNREMSFFFDNPLIFNPGATDISGYLNISSYSSNDGQNFSYSITSQTITGTIDSDGSLKLNQQNISRVDTTFASDSGVIEITGYPGNIEPEVKNSNSELPSGLPPAQSLNRNEFVDWVKKRANEFQNMSDQMIAEVYQWEKTMEVNKDEVNYALKRALMFSGIETPFEFAIIKDGKIGEGLYNKTEKNDFLKSKYMVQLFPDNIIRQNLLVSVIFPDKANYVLGSMSWLLGGSFLFSLIILATFALSLFFIIRQKKISEMKSDFLNNMTHEFKTPIATISLAADTITNPKVIKDELSIRHFIGMIKKENSRMNNKVETILQIASLDKKEIEFKFENLSIHSIIERAVESIEIQVHQRNGQITLNLTAIEPVICGDFEHLTNLISNLLDNALKYSPSSPEIIVETKNNEKGIILSVVDKGSGMSKSVQSKIFERFYRQTSGNIHDVKGFGLGLNYVKAIVDAHKGTITVFSEPGKGSRFIIFLPFNCQN